MAAGRICTGYSLPYVAKYSNTGTTITYTQGQKLARGVDVSMEASASDDNTFFADNGNAESTAGKFNGGTCTMTVDGILPATAKLILGLPDPGENGLTAYGDTMVVPYVGIGFIRRYQSDNVVTYVPTILPKCRFSVPSDGAKTQEDAIEWQTQQLSAAVLRDDTAEHNWKYEGSEVSTEAAAEAVIKSFFKIS